MHWKCYVCVDGIMIYPNTQNCRVLNLLTVSTIYLSFIADQLCIDQFTEHRYMYSTCINCSQQCYGTTPGFFSIIFFCLCFVCRDTGMVASLTTVLSWAQILSQSVLFQGSLISVHHHRSLAITSELPQQILIFIWPPPISGVCPELYIHQSQKSYGNYVSRDMMIHYAIYSHMVSTCTCTCSSLSTINSKRRHAQDPN